MAAVISDPEYVLRGVASVVFGRTYHLLAPTTIGRSPECDIYLDVPGISRKHARLRPLPEGVEIEDLNSTNGSFVNGHRLVLGIARVGDEIAFDQLRFRLGSVPKAQESASAGALPKGRGRSRARWAWWAALAAVIAAAAVAVFIARP
jgi:hypothetical protein